MFPINPSSSEIDERGLFIVQDPALRSRILPLFSFDPRTPENRPIGTGTTFRIDPWSRCATAFHVVEDMFEPGAEENTLVVKSDFRLAALELNGIFWGQRRLPPNAWRAISQSFSIFGIETQPLQLPRIRNACEMMVIRIRPSESPAPYLPVDLRRWRPKIGQKVLALGFAGLDQCPSNGDEARPIAQSLYGSFGTISSIEDADGAGSRPWPKLRVEATWPGGMSGGPVFNEAGHVIGLVSTGIEGLSIGTATFFSGWDIPERIFGVLDADNPGQFFCHAVFNYDGALRYCSQDEHDAKEFAKSEGISDIGMVSINPITGQYARLR